MGANFYINVPQTPSKENRAAQSLVPLGNAMQGFLGVTGDHSTWGRGVTIAILDSGVITDNTFGQGCLQHLDIGLGTAAGTGPEDGHGTDVAALAAGNSPNAPGVAPVAGIVNPGWAMNRNDPMRIDSGSLQPLLRRDDQADGIRGAEPQRTGRQQHGGERRCRRCHEHLLHSLPDRRHHLCGQDSGRSKATGGRRFK